MIARTILTFLERHHILPQRMVIACSGGIDSTALLLSFADLRPQGFEIVCGHVNHHLRGAESDGDELFVRELCGRLSVPVEVGDGTLDPAAIRQSGIEAAARQVRHQRLDEIRENGGARLVATAHQRNDQAETVLMRMLTGTGLAGLRGIHPVREDGYIRPLLDATRDQITAFLEERGVVARNDSLNDDPRYLRNRVRRTLASYEPAAIDNLAAIADQSREIWPLVERALDQEEKRCVRLSGEETRFVSWPEDPWTRRALLLRHIRRLGPAREISARDLERLAGSLDRIRRVSVTRDLELIRRRGALVLRRRPLATPEFEVELGVSAYIPEIGTTIRVLPTVSAQLRGTNRFQLPDGATATFTIRNRRRGDRVHPLGMSRDKKLKDFLIDRKIDAEIRDRLPLVIWNGDIVLIPGVEVSERFKVTSPAGALFEVNLEYESQSQTADQHGRDREPGP
ncbi:MAG: tRNA lysidine(34) synthetase TilS [Thermoanaerobaculia bacterium]